MSDQFREIYCRVLILGVDKIVGFEGQSICLEHFSGNMEWLKDGKRHRENGPAVSRVNGSKYWYKNGRLHREDGPAIERANGYKEWWVNGRCHRLSGYAVEIPTKSEWWVNGFQYYTYQEFRTAVRKYMGEE